MGNSEGNARTENLRLALQAKLKKFSGLILYVLITILVLTLYVGKYGFLERLSVQMQDGMFKLRGKADTLPADIVIVGIDDRSVDLVGKWPWQRDILAQLVYAISQGEPKVLGLDLFLPEQIEEDTSGRTDLLAYYVRAADNVLIPMYFSLSDVGIAPEVVPDPIRKSAVGTDGDLSKTAATLISAKQIYYPSPALIEASSRFGHINIDYDKDGLIRREPLLIGYDGYLYPSFGMQLAREYLKVADSELKPVKEGGMTFGNIDIPTDERHRLRLNYLGPNLSFERISAIEVLAGEVDPETFAKKVVLVGLTTTESKTWVNVPAFGEINEVERIATVTHNLIHHDFLKRLLPIWNALIMVLIGVFCAVVLPKVSLTHRIVILLVFLFVMFNLSYILFSSFGTLTRPAYPILELVFFLLAAPAIKPGGMRKRSEGEEIEKGDGEQAVEEAGLILTETTGEADETTAEGSTPIVFRVPQGEERQGERSERTESTKQEQSEEESTEEETAKLSIIPTGSTPSGMSSTRVPEGESPCFSQFGRYKIIEAIGKGGMGMVYKGTDPMLDRPVALKTIRLDFPLSPTETAELKDRLIQEAKAAGKLSHPNVVTIYDVGEHGGLHYIAMEYLSGYSLEDFIKKKGELNYRIVARIIIQTCEALSYAHQHGIVHRDIKPANIMLQEDFHVKVMDFGIARLETTSLTKSNIALGTPHYISPEQLEGRQADKRSDIFSLGVVLYEILTRRKPFQGQNISSLMYRVLNYDPPPPSSVSDKTPLIFDRVVSKAMAKNPEERYQDAAEMSETLTEFVSSFVVTRGIRM
ncbi:MAG: CHASE2 domain-containing protein [Candidatus Zixiibacteriota bacterium]|nr:MAG: CHASE2 domain-containing protein [candidate division Zixibacteria bacterium]